MHDPSELECLFASAVSKTPRKVLKKGNYLDAFVARAIDWKEAKMLSTHFVYETGLGAKTYRLVMKNSKLLKSWACERIQIGAGAYPECFEFTDVRKSARCKFWSSNLHCGQPNCWRELTGKHTAVATE
ncbi:unnamed protein product [Bathycoccus prasinos]